MSIMLGGGHSKFIHKIKHLIAEIHFLLAEIYFFIGVMIFGTYDQFITQTVIRWPNTSTDISKILWINYQNIVSHHLQPVISLLYRKYIALQKNQIITSFKGEVVTLEIA